MTQDKYNWQEEFNNKFCAMVMGRILSHLWGHGTGGPGEVRDFIKSKLAELIGDFEESLGHSSGTNYKNRVINTSLVKIKLKQLRDKWLK